MRRTLLLLFVLGLTPALPLPAQAGAHADALAQCLIRATSPDDRKVALRWAFATMALDPDVAALSAVTPAQRDLLNRQAAMLVTDLLAKSCREPVQQALLLEGPSAARTAFEAWGRWAVTGLASEPHVVQGLGGLMQYLDIGKLLPLVPLQGLLPPAGTR